MAKRPLITSVNSNPGSSSVTRSGPPSTQITSMTLRSYLPSYSNLQPSFRLPLSPPQLRAPHRSSSQPRGILGKANIYQEVTVIPKRNFPTRAPFRGGTEIAIGTEREIENETGTEIDHANPPGITTPSLPVTRLRGVMRRLEELPRRPSRDGLTRYGIQGEHIPRHPNIPWSRPGSHRDNRNPRLLLKLSEGRSRPLTHLQTPTRMEPRPSSLSFPPRSPLLLTRIQFTHPLQGRVNRRLHLHRCKSHNRIRAPQRQVPPLLSRTPVQYPSLRSHQPLRITHTPPRAPVLVRI